jgi:hypothetical protein
MKTKFNFHATYEERNEKRKAQDAERPEQPIKAMTVSEAQIMKMLKDGRSVILQGSLVRGDGLHVIGRELTKKFNNTYPGPLDKYVKFVELLSMDISEKNSLFEKMVDDGLQIVSVWRKEEGPLPLPLQNKLTFVILKD